MHCYLLIFGLSVHLHYVHVSILYVYVSTYVQASLSLRWYELPMSSDSHFSGANSLIIIKLRPLVRATVNCMTSLLTMADDLDLHCFQKRAKNEKNI